ncbi:MAG: RNA methyltransferase, partial [Deltaproteobacteria bacterium]|nr:RNA methyltransferase [Deltaproteobacteria bacterium]
VVDPTDCDFTRILKLATHFAADLVADMEVYEDLGSALAPFHYVVGTTARVGSHRPTRTNVQGLAESLVSISQENLVALVFGPESYGLTNQESRLCDALVTIPTSEFASLNVAQAVMILCYEIFLASREAGAPFTPRMATRRELEDMYEQLKETFVRINFINAENPDYWMQHIRRFFSRAGVRARDVKMARGICRQIEWYGSRRKNKGFSPRDSF